MSNKDIAIIEKQLTPTLKEVEELDVVDEKSEIEASELLSKLNLVGDAMKEKKAKVYDPAWATIVAIRAEWKPKETILENAIAAVRAKLSKYRTAAKAKADAEEAKIAARIAPGKGNLSIETGVKKIEEIDRPAAAVTTNAGMVKYKTVQKFEVIDMKLLPLEYHLPNEVAIRKMMLAGQKLEGVRYFEEQIPQNFR